jgi:hypothetical protein
VHAVKKVSLDNTKRTKIYYQQERKTVMCVCVCVSWGNRCFKVLQNSLFPLLLVNAKKLFFEISKLITLKINSIIIGETFLDF